MIITLQDTSTREVDARLLQLREEGGVVALGRVLSLIIVTSGDVEPAIAAANDASREHPCRVIVVNRSTEESPDGRLDAEVRVGADAGASDVVILSPSGPTKEDIDTLVMPLLLPDTPIVVWWPNEPPLSPAAGLLGQIAQRRISDVYSTADPIVHLKDLASEYSPGDTDLSWARTTLWRGLTAATLDTTADECIDVSVHGNIQHPSVLLLAGWLKSRLRVPVRIQKEENASAITGVTIIQASGVLRLHRPEGSSTLTMSIPGQGDQHVALPMRGLSECLVEDLRRLDPDETYAAALRSITEVELT